MRFLSILLGLAAMRQAEAVGPEYTSWETSLDSVPTPSFSPEGSNPQQVLYDRVAEESHVPPLQYTHPFGQVYDQIYANELGGNHQQASHIPYPSQGMLVYDHAGTSSTASDQSYDYASQWQEGGLPPGANLMQRYYSMNTGDASTLLPPPLRKTPKRPPRSRVPRGTFGQSSARQKEEAKPPPKIAARFAEEDAAAQRLRAQIGHLWDRKGLWVGMEPKELAAGIIEIKLSMRKEELGVETGPVLAQHIREHPDSAPGYAAQVSDWGKKYFSRMRRLRERYAKETPLRSEEERDADIYKYIRFVKSRDEYRALARNKSVQKDEATKIKREAGKIWQALLEHCQHSGLSTIDETTPMEVVEEQSRYLFLFLEPYTPDEVADYVRFYLMHVFHKTAEEVDEFNRARNGCLQTAHLAAQQGQQEGQEGEALLEGLNETTYRG